MYTVVWKNAALDRLADAFVAADLPTRDRLERAVLAVNARLADAPHDEGESRPGGRRITFVGQVAVLFDVDPAARRARVLNFWTVKPRRR